MTSAPKILIVDNDESTRGTIESVLRQAEFRVLSAPTSEDALVILEHHSDVDMVVLDLMMPGLSGFDLLNILKSDSTRAHINAQLQSEVAERKHAESQLLRRNRELSALNAIAQTVSQFVDLDEILESALSQITKLLDIEHVLVALFEDDRRHLSLRAHRGIVPQAVPKWRVGEGILGHVAKSGQPLFVGSIPDPMGLMSQSGVKAARKHRVSSMMYMPLKARGNTLGVMAAVTQDSRVFTLEERELLITIGHQISTAIENAQLIGEASQARALAELDQLKTTLLASVSHELKTPLTYIKGLASTLIQTDVEWDAGDQREFLGIIDRQAGVLSRLVDDLMQMSQLEAGVMRMQRKQTSVMAIVDPLRRQLEGIGANHHLVIDVPRALPSVCADEIRIGQVITNLVSNACAYSDHGSRVVLSAEACDGAVVIGVADQGIGIAPDQIEKVFDRFHRLEAGVARRRGGTGLGLSICKGIIEGHGGMMRVASEPGHGSSFSFSLPVMEDAEA